MIQSPAIGALPPVGPLLGAAYDRGLTTLIRSWRVAAILIAAECLIASVPSLAQSTLGNILLFIWTFYSMANAIRVVFDPQYRMSNRTAGDMFAAQIATAVFVVVVNIVGIVALVQPVRTGVTWLLVAPGVVAGIWLYVKFACGPALAAQETSAIKSLGESWRLTSGAYWQTFVFPIANFAANILIALAIATLAQALFRYQNHGFLAQTIPIASTVLIFVGEIYVMQSYNIAVCMWLKALRDIRPEETEILEPVTT